MSEPTIHIGPYQLMPQMTLQDFAALKADIAARGVVTPIDVDEEGAILDGHHRFRAWSELQRNELPPVIVRTGLSKDEKRSFALRANVHRRHLTRGQMQELIERELKGRPDHSDRMIAADLGVDHKTIGRLRRELNATGELSPVEKTIGADGKARRAKASPEADGKARRAKAAPEAVGEVAQWAKAFGGKVGFDSLPDDAKLAILKAGIPVNSVVTIPGSLFNGPVLSAEQERDWRSFGQLLETKCGWSEDYVVDHCHWVLRRSFLSPDEWLGEEGAKFRKRCGIPEPSDEFKGQWRELKVTASSP